MARVNRDDAERLFSHNVDLTTRTLYLGYGEAEDYEVDARVAADLLKGLHLMEKSRSDEPITLLINSQGGCVDHGLALYSRIKRHPSHVTAVVDGVCWSIAAWVLQAADRRVVSTTSSLMIHDGSGPKDAFTRRQDLLCRDILLQRIRERNQTFSVQKLQKLLDKDTYMFGPEAVALGLADEVLS